jgi:hypothetical protein
LTAVVSNYREGGISVFVLAYFVSSHGELRGIREAVGVPLRVVRLSDGRDQCARPSSAMRVRSSGSLVATEAAEPCCD